MFTSKEIREYFESATEGKHTAKGRNVTREMMERDAITETIKKVRETLPPKVVGDRTYKLRKVSR